MLFKLQILSLSLEPGIPFKAKDERPRNIFLDLWSQGQPKRRYFLGRFGSSKQKRYASVVHFTSTPVTLQLSFGVGGVALLYNNLGRHTLFEFLDDPHSSKTERRQFLPFGRGGPVYHLEYILKPVTCAYGFVLNEISCLSQVSSKLRKDPLDVEVEFNNSRHSILPGVMNRYSMGTFSSNEVSTIHSVNNCSFASLSNFVVTFYVRGWLSDHILGTIKLLPLDEVLQNDPAKVLRLLDHQQLAHGSSGVAAPRAPTRTKVDEIMGDNCEADEQVKDDYARLEELAGKGGLLFSFMDHPEDPEEMEEELLLISDDETLITKTLNLSSPEGGSYVIVLSLTKEKEGMAGDHVVPAHLWNFVSRRDYYLLRGNEPEPDAIHHHRSDEAADSDNNSTRGTDAMVVQGKRIGAKDIEGDMVTSDSFSNWTQGNDVDVLIDGLETFERMFECMMLAQHSISILAWEVSLSFGLILVQRAKIPIPPLTPPSAKWVSLEDVLLSRALSGVRVRIIVWRHELVSHINRMLYMGEWSIDSEVAKLQSRCQKHGLVCKVFHTITNIPDGSSSYANPYDNETDANVVVIIAGNPKGIYSAHHEKLVLIDAECPPHTVAFTGGFDIARGRYDQPLHQLPRPYWEDLNPMTPSTEDQMIYGHEVQPLLRRIRILWHDIQLMIKGPAAQHFQLHFAQRWSYAFTHDPSKTRNLTHYIPHTRKACKHRPQASYSMRYGSCPIRLTRIWNGVFEGHFLFDEYSKMITGAKKFIYFEHQYPFQNFALTYYMCQALRNNPSLLVIIVAPVKTDLPRGIVGEWIDWSQDQIVEHLHLIHRVAPDRVGLYGLVRQDDRTERIKPIYVHAKLAIVDDECILTGTTNMDNMSFFYSSELSVTVAHPALAKGTRVRLLKEHLGSFYRPAMAETDHFGQVFDTFRDVASRNSASLRANGTLVGRPVSMAPDNYQFLLNRVYYPNKLSKFLSKTVGWDTEDMLVKLRSRLFSTTKPEHHRGRPGTKPGSGPPPRSTDRHPKLKAQL